MHTTPDKKHFIVYRDEKLYCAFPDIVKLQNGEFLVVFREAPRRKNVTHLDPESSAVVLRSRDGGVTWGDRTIIHNDQDAVQDPSIMQLCDGTILSNFFKWRITREKEALDGLGPIYSHVSSDRGFPEAYWAAIVGAFVTRSLDGGKTWQTPMAVGSGKYKALSTSSPSIECQTGRLLMPLYINLDENLGKQLKLNFEGQMALIAGSTDAGKTWPEMIPVASDAKENVLLEEPALVQLRSGKILCMMRVSSAGGDYLRQCESFDEGRTWSPSRKTVIMGHPPHLLQLHDGRVLCSYGYRHQPFGIRACLSNDEGKTWDIEHEIIVRNDGRNPDLGYPSSVEIKPGMILTVYYFHDETETRFIAGSIFAV